MDKVPDVTKSARRMRADVLKQFICKHLLVVLENPSDIKNIGTVIRNVNALGISRLYVIDGNNVIPKDWDAIREHRALNKLSVSASKWSFVKVFATTQECLDHLKGNNYKSIVTSPHIKGKVNVSLRDGDYTKLHKLAVWFGTEKTGISDLAVEHAEMCVSVPMFGMIESLNLASCTAIVMFEVTSQRREYQSLYRYRGKRGKRETPLPTVIETVVA